MRVIGDFAAAEFASGVARLTRMVRLTIEEATAVFSSFDAWKVYTASPDIMAATGFLRRLDLNLRTPDASNIGIADRLGATLATFDERMAMVARTLGVAVAQL